MSMLSNVWGSLKNLDEKAALKLFVFCLIAFTLIDLFDVVSAWSRRYSLEVEAASFGHQEERRKLDLAAERDRLMIEKERRDLGLDAPPSAQPLRDLGDIFLKIGPYALLFYSIAQAWSVFATQESSRLRLALSVSFSAVVVGFVLIVGGFASPTTLRIGIDKQQVEVSSESLGIVVVAIGAFMFLAALAIVRAKPAGQEGDVA